MQILQGRSFKCSKLLFVDGIDIWHIIDRVLIQPDLKRRGLNEVSGLKCREHGTGNFGALVYDAKHMADMLEIG